MEEQAKEQACVHSENIAEQLRSMYEEYTSYEHLAAGDIVTWKPGMQSCIGNGPFIILSTFMKDGTLYARVGFVGVPSFHDPFSCSQLLRSFGVMEVDLQRLRKLPEPSETQGMSFGKAMEELKKGFYVAREGWANAIFVDCGRVKRTKSGYMDWFPTHADILADDWSIVAHRLQGPGE